ncbi:DUF6286 domain-containing protein [Parasphingorhabdus pacifica]
MRIVLRLITALLGLATATLGALLLTEVFWWWWSRPDSGGVVVSLRTVLSGLRGVSWGDVPVRVTAAGAVVVGLLLLLLAARSGRTEIRLHDPAPEVTVTTDPRSLARLVGHQVRAQDGVSAASVTARRTRVRVRVTSRFSELGDLHARVRRSVDDAIGELPMSRQPKVSVSVSPPKERA